MNHSRKKSIGLILVVLISCIAMAVIETVIEPAYFVKSGLKIIFFFIVPLCFLKLRKEAVFTKAFALNKKSVPKLLLLGVVIYAVIMAAFFLTRGVFDYNVLVQSLSTDQNVSDNSFISVALYISFCNSLLEEFLFRFFAFLKLSESATKKTSYLFSALMFAVYHVAMIGASFPTPLFLLALLGLAIGGGIFNYIDDKSGSFYDSWIIHMFADFAIMTIWYIHI